MWISRKHYDDERVACAEARAEAKILSEQCRALLTTQDWLRVQLNQAQHERSHFMHLYSGVKIPPPEIARDTAPVERVADALHGLPNFEDLGDEAAHKAGVSWNLDGTLKYS